MCFVHGFLSKLLWEYSEGQCLVKRLLCTGNTVSDLPPAGALK